MSYTNVPIGAVIAYAGELTSSTPLQNWWLCDGVAMSNSTYSTLAGVIGTYYGENPDGNTFCLPDYSGQFLRGVDGGTGRDPDSATRTAPTNQPEPGNSGAKVGSVQASGMVSHNHAYPAYVTSTKTDWQALTGPTNSATNGGTQAPGSGAAGGSELRPVNQYVSFALLGEQPTGAVMPVGSVIAYAGELPSDTLATLKTQGWLPCDGSSQLQSDYPSLFDVTATRYGSLYADDFCLPLYNGRFFRGNDPDGRRDPDYDAREAPRPDLSTSNAGTTSGVGSMQSDCVPAHFHSYSCWSGSHDCAYQQDPMTVAAAVNTTLQTTATVDASTTVSDTSCPVNVALNYLIAYTDTQLSIPSGAVIAFAGDVTDPGQADNLEGWLTCDGGSYSSADYPALFAAIGTCNGGSSDGTTFNVPDLQGRFVVAVDPDDTARTAAASGGNTTGVGSLQESQLGDHTHSVLQASTSTTVDMGFTSDCISTTSSNWATQGLTIDTAPSGYPTATLTSENRPINQYVYFLIKT